MFAAAWGVPLSPPRSVFRSLRRLSPRADSPDRNALPAAADSAELHGIPLSVDSPRERTLPPAAAGPATERVPLSPAREPRSSAESEAAGRASELRRVGGGGESFSPSAIFVVMIARSLRMRMSVT